MGIAEIDSDCKKLKVKRRSLLPVEVRKSDSHVTVKNMGVAKQYAHNKQLREDGNCEWILLYPDFDLVLHLPGTESPFSVGKYKESIGRAYSRVNLYLSRLSDYESKYTINFYTICRKMYVLKNYKYVVNMQIE